MTETAVRDLMRQAMAGYEPPMGPVLGEALRAARRARRQRLAGSVAAAAAVAAGLVVGLSTVGGQIAAHGQERRNLTLAQFVFIRPALPYTRYVPVHPITSAALGQLLISELPAGAGYSHIEASASAHRPGATGRTANASLNEVTTAIGAGAVQVQMVAVGATDAGFGCAPGLALGRCKAYSLRGGVKVVEEYASAGPSSSRLRLVTFQVQVFRPRVAVVRLSESNGTPSGALSLAMPLTAAQLLAAAVDPRWQFNVTRPTLSAAGSGRGMVT